MVDLIWDFKLDNSHQEYKFACKNYQEKLYLALVKYTENDLLLEITISVFDYLSRQWSQIYQKPIKPEKALDKYQVKILKIKGISKHNLDDLIFIFEYDDRCSTLQLKPDNQLSNINPNNSNLQLLIQELFREQTERLLWRIEPQNNELIDKKPQLKIIDLDDLFTSPPQTVALPQNLIEEQFKVSQLSFYQNILYLGADHPQQGFSLWRQVPQEGNEDSWQPIISKGAYRYNLNQKILFMKEFRECLYVVSALDLEPQNWAKNKLYPNGFEMIRIYDDHDWDIIIGTPQFSPQGLKVPLSGFNSGFDNPYNCIVESLTVSQDKLYLLTSNIDKLELWQSDNGEDWESQTLAYDIYNYTQFKIIETIPFLGGIIFIINFTDLYLNKSSQIVFFEDKQ